MQTLPYPYNIAPVRADFLVKARAAGIDDLGQPVERLVATGGEPCRDAFRRAEAGEALILASYCPFERASPYREYGPIYILAEADANPAPPSLLPISGPMPYLASSFVLRAYSLEERIAGAVLVTPADAGEQLQRMFVEHDPAFVLARFPTYGCYALRIERAGR